MQAHESAENYLECILILSKKLAAVRSIDISKELGFSRPSISLAMKRLRESGCISIDDSGYITLEPEGKAIAENTYRRHLLLCRVLTALGVSEETAQEDACRIEHVLSQESFDRLFEYVETKRKAGSAKTAEAAAAAQRMDVAGGPPAVFQ
ncbi:MAG: metal-dependent transcriptional regulator [Mailhella sp.]|nr:metal-dependent transcriptional regulator [Mailhella sp.]